MRTRSRSNWGALALVAPVAAASLVGSVVWMRDHDPRAAAAEVQQQSAEAGVSTSDPVLQELAARVAQLQARADRVRGQAQGLASADAGQQGGNGAAEVPASAPEPAPQPDTYTGASGG
ncbi:MAG: hypothetical protein ACKOT0_06435 [bacterium]